MDREYAAPVIGLSVQQKCGRQMATSDGKAEMKRLGRVEVPTAIVMFLCTACARMPDDSEWWPKSHGPVTGSLAGGTRPLNTSLVNGLA
jgi:hypothetical protein